MVSLALLITEGRTPECSVKGRSESFHCPPAQSCSPGTTKHECSDKLAQVRTVCVSKAFYFILFLLNLYKLHKFCHHLCYITIIMFIFKYKISHNHIEKFLSLDHSQEPWLLNKALEGTVGSFADQQADRQPISYLSYSLNLR